MDKLFSGQLALIAGGTGALGRAVSLAFLDEGATVVVTYQKSEELELLRQQAGAQATRIEGHRLDVTSEAAAGRWFQLSSRAMGGSMSW
jgi:NAD(P)-dependent dehydrogenase (short-subunit alcohol dehydrogenase family)